MKGFTSQPNVDLNPGESIDRLTYDLERMMLLSRSEIAAGQILSLYLSYTPSSSYASIFGVYDILVTEIKPYYGEEHQDGDISAGYPWDVNYLFNPNSKALNIDKSKRRPYALVADTIDEQSIIRDPARLGDRNSGFIGDRREYLDSPLPNFGKAIKLDLTNA